MGDPYPIKFQWCTGTATIRIVDTIKSVGLINVTNLDITEGQLGNQFDINDSGDSKYIVITGVTPTTQIRIPSGISFTTKTFSLVEVTQISTK